tara:strand:+ start:858 stop:1664 length:807 start_codon:yes stop_codon:yes gene_type:complete
MKKAVNHQYEKFIKVLSKTSVVEGRRWYGLEFTNKQVVFDYWDSLSDRSKSKVASDSRWNHYPLCSYTKSSKKRFGAIIGEIVKRSISKGDESLIKPLINNSSGVFAIYVMDNATSSTRIKMAKRLKKSPDTRIRSRCARILPIRFVGDMLSDKNYSVRSMAITRIGIDNCYKNFIPDSLSQDKSARDWWYYNWLSRQALKLGDKAELGGLIDEAKNMNINKDDLSKIEMILSVLISRLSPEECLYFMGLGQESSYVKRVLEEKMGHV